MPEWNTWKKFHNYGLLVEKSMEKFRGGAHAMNNGANKKEKKSIKNEKWVRDIKRNDGKI